MKKKILTWKLGVLAAFIASAIMVGSCSPNPDPVIEVPITPTPAELPPDLVGSSGGSANGTGKAESSSSSDATDEDGEFEFIDPSLTCKEVLASGPCYHPYVPVAEGFSRSYQSDDGMITQTVGVVREDGFTLNIEGPDGEVMASEWTCDAGGITGYELEDSLTEYINNSGISGGYSSVEINGIVLPASIHAGDTWQVTVTITVGIAQSGVDSKNVIVLVVDYAAIGKETITIPAGTFTAMRIDFATIGENNLEISAAGGGSMSQKLASIEATGSDWYVECLGKVRGISKGTITGIANSQHDSLMELTSFSLP